MKYILGLPTDQVQLIEEFGTAEAIAEIASKAETGDLYWIREGSD